MKINKANITHIHDLLITDIQRRLFKQHNEIKIRNPFTIVTDEDYDTQCTMLVDSILHTNTISDINDIVIEYGDLFDKHKDIGVCTLDGTMNYVLSLVLEYYTRFKHKSLYYEEDYN
tara:strand:- start:279 stop:629 length:351 start_codon:yes stop_codon:yes gene_type:complete